MLDPAHREFRVRLIEAAAFQPPARRVRSESRRRLGPEPGGVV